MTISVEEYAKLSLEIYDGVIPAGWEPAAEPRDNTLSGFYAQAYRKIGTEPGEIVIVFRGTEGLSDAGDVAADVAIKFDGEHQQFEDALEYAA